MRRRVSNSCIVCALNPIIFPGRLLGCLPVIAICPHIEETATSQIFRKDNSQTYLGVLWILATAASSIGYIWLVTQTRNIALFKRLSEMLNCINNTSVIFFSLKHVDILLNELNGLCCILNNRRCYNLDKLISSSTVTFLRAFSMVAIGGCYSVYLTLFGYVAYDGFEGKIANVFYASGVTTGGLCATITYNQLWVKMFLMRDVHKTSFAEIKKFLRNSLLLERGRLEDDIVKVIRLHMAIVRNYKECNRFWSPAMVYSQILAIGILILGFYDIVTNLSLPDEDRSFGIQVQLHTAFLTVALILVYSTQGWLQNVVSLFFLIPNSILCYTG